MTRSKKIFLASVLFGLTVTGSVRAADGPRGQAGPGGQDGPPRENATQITGIVASYNLDRRGSINGIMIKDGDQLAQLNAPPDQAIAIKAAAPIGQKIQATANPERSNSDHAVYRLQTLTGADGKQLTIDGPSGGKTIHVDGTVKSLNYSPRGETDGAILETGDFIQMGPGAAREAALAVGAKVSVDGTARPMTDGHNIINPTSVNGIDISQQGPGNGGPPDGGPGGGGFGGAPDGGGPGGGDMPPPPPGN